MKNRSRIPNHESVLERSDEEDSLFQNSTDIQNIKSYDNRKPHTSETQRKQLKSVARAFEWKGSKYSEFNNIINSSQESSFKRINKTTRSTSTERKRIATEYQTADSRKPSYEITPEIAAKVIKEYLLPMFGNESNKESPFRTKSTSNKNTVYGELKLSDQLMDQITKLKIELSLQSDNKVSIEKKLVELTEKFSNFQMKYEIMQYK